MISCTFVPGHARKGADLFGDHLYNIINKNIRLLTARFRSILSEEDIEDLVHDTYIRICDKRDRFNPGGNFAGWVYRICRNCVYDCASQAQRFRGRLLTLPVDKDYDRSSVYDDSNADSSVIRQEEERRILNVIGNLKPENRELAYMLIDGVPYNEMAEVLGCSENTVKTRVCRFRQQLRNYGLVG